MAADPDPPDFAAVDGVRVTNAQTFGGAGVVAVGWGGGGGLAAEPAPRHVMPGDDYARKIQEYRRGQKAR